MFTPKMISPNFPFKSNQRLSKILILTPRCDAHRGARLRGMMHSIDFFTTIFFHDSVVWCTLRSLTLWRDAHHGAWFCSMMHTAESDSVGWCTPWNLLPGMMHTAELCKISKSKPTEIRKYFSLFISCPDGFESWQKSRCKISWHTPFNQAFLNYHLLLEKTGFVNIFFFFLLLRPQQPQWLYFKFLS